MEVIAVVLGITIIAVGIVISFLFGYMLADSRHTKAARMKVQQHWCELEKRHKELRDRVLEG